jgi:nucleoside-diphosphate-sugar epimerase
MKILITGGLGFIGEHLERRLIRENHDVYIMDKNRVPRPKYYRGDIVDYINMKEIFKQVKPDVVFHLAAMVSRKECEETPVMAIATNVNGTLNIVNLCMEYNARLIYAGSSEEYGDAYNEQNDFTVDENTPFGTPTSYYSMTKRMSDEIIQYNAKYNKLIATTTRFCMLYGAESYSEYRSAITRFIYAAMDNDTIFVHADTERSWCYIDDAIDALILVLNRKQEESYEVFNVGMEEPITAVNLAKQIGTILKTKSEIKVVQVEPTIIPIKRANFDKAKKILNWEAKTSLYDGLYKTISDIEFKNF